MSQSRLNRTFRLETYKLDLDLWQKLYYKHQQEYLRKRLIAIKYLCEGKTRAEVSELLNCSYKTLSIWIDKFLEGGLLELVKPITHQLASSLSPEQKQEIKRMLLTEKPVDYGIDRNIWTGEIISSVIEMRWGVKLKTTRIYEILSELKLSHQKAHRDYANADLALSPKKMGRFQAHSINGWVFSSTIINLPIFFTCKTLDQEQQKTFVSTLKKN